MQYKTLWLRCKAPKKKPNASCVACFQNPKTQNPAARRINWEKKPESSILAKGTSSPQNNSYWG